MTISPDMQEALLVAAAQPAVTVLLEYIAEHGPRLAELAVTRATGPDGQAYGDTSWHLTPSKLMAEMDAEIADAIVYACMGIQRGVVVQLSRGAL